MTAETKNLPALPTGANLPASAAALLDEANKTNDSVAFRPAYLLFLHPLQYKKKEEFKKVCADTGAEEGDLLLFEDKGGQFVPRRIDPNRLLYTVLKDKYSWEKGEKDEEGKYVVTGRSMEKKGKGWKQMAKAVLVLVILKDGVGTDPNVSLTLDDVEVVTAGFMSGPAGTKFCENVSAAQKSAEDREQWVKDARDETEREQRNRLCDAKIPARYRIQARHESVEVVEAKNPFTSHYGVPTTASDIFVAAIFHALQSETFNSRLTAAVDQFNGRVEEWNEEAEALKTA